MSSTTVAPRVFPYFLLVYVATLATFGLVAGAIYLRTPIDPWLAMSSWCLAFGVYGLNRFTDVEDAINDPQRRMTAQRNRLFTVSVAGALVGGVALLAIGHRFTLFHVFLFCVGVAYSLKVIPWLGKNGRMTLVRLKEIPFAKSTAVAFCFGSAFFLLNYLVFPGFVQSRVTSMLLMMVSCGVAVFVNTNYCDVRDVVGDRASGIPTIPARYGVCNAALFTMLVPSTVWAAAVVFLFISHRIDAPHFVFFVVNLLYPLVYLGAHFSKVFPQRVVTTLADSCILVIPVGLIALRLAS